MSMRATLAVGGKTRETFMRLQEWHTTLSTWLPHERVPICSSGCHMQ